MLAFHGIFGAYGFWLPNDPRGSWSQWVGSWELYCYGPATKVNARQSLAAKRHDRNQRLAAKAGMKHKPVRFSGVQARAIAMGFADAIQKHQFECYACAIMPDHIHIAMRSERMGPGQVIGMLKRAAGDRLVKEGLHPFGGGEGGGQRPPLCFARRAWKVYLDTGEDLRRSIAYVMQNPPKDGLPLQRWSFVQVPRIG